MHKSLKKAVRGFIGQFFFNKPTITKQDEVVEVFFWKNLRIFLQNLHSYHQLEL